MVRTSLRLHIQALIAALQFLTRLPIPVNVAFQSSILVRSVIYFPVAGLIIGGCAAAAAWLLILFVPAWPAAVLLLAIWTALSGGLHLDGWMDTADGVLSYRSRESMLEIMKDSRVGAMGVAAAILLLLLKASLLAELLNGDSEVRMYTAATLILSSVWSRAWLAAAIAGWPPAREGEGIGVLFNGVKGYQAALAMLIAAIISFMSLNIIDINNSYALILVLSAFLLTVLCGGMLAAWLNKKLGGLTGDTYGAMNEAIETALLLAAVIALNAVK